MTRMCVLLLLLLNSYGSPAQYKLFDLFGLEVRKGYHFHKENGWEDYSYEVCQLEVRVGGNLVNSSTTRLTLFSSLQLANAAYKRDFETNYITLEEIGINLHLRATFVLNKWVSPFVAGLFGVQCTSKSIHRQSGGFMFSNAIQIGLVWLPQAKVNIITSIGIRHLSNLGFKLPNNGINNGLFGLGLEIDL